VNQLLQTGGADRPVVPVRERSLELFGDELGALLGGALFRGDRRLTLELLRCY
jgi:hypothetical protein